MRQKKWLELLKDYHLKISNYPRKANRVADALSRKNTGSLVVLITDQARLFTEFKSLEIEVVRSSENCLAALIAQPTLLVRINESQELMINYLRGRLMC